MYANVGHPNWGRLAPMTAQYTATAQAAESTCSTSLLASPVRATAATVAALANTTEQTMRTSARLKLCIGNRPALRTSRARRGREPFVRQTEQIVHSGEVDLHDSISAS